MSDKLDVSVNPAKYVWFTTLYNARAYYPILAILFLDLGLTLDQYVMLNLVWALTIFFFEVPSGALADTLGRKTLLVSAAVLMIFEMSCLLFAPKDGGWLLFSLCVINRLLSGLSEAAASGADEALAYDSLPDGKKDDLWDDLLSKAMRYRSVAFVFAMIAGGLLYDSSFINKALPEGLQISPELAHRLPIALVLLQGLACLGISLSMVEPKKALDESFWKACKTAIRLTLETTKWVFTNPKTRVFVIIGLSIDSVIRNFATIISGYYRLIELPEWSFGFIGAAIGLGGIMVPTVAAWLNKRFSSLATLGIIAALGLIGLAGLTPANSYWCIIPAMMLLMTMGALSFTMSRSLNRESESSTRATVLSVKGLAFNLGYGAFSLGFSGLLASLSKGPAESALKEALFWQVPFYAVVTFGLLFCGKYLLRRASVSASAKT